MTETNGPARPAGSAADRLVGVPPAGSWSNWQAGPAALNRAQQHVARLTAAAAARLPGGGRD